MAKRYRVTASVRFSNAMTALFVRVGIRMGSISLLTVRGRKSGKPIVTPIAIFTHEGKRYLIAAYGVVNWVRNLRAAGGAATLTRGRRTETISARELPLEEAAPILRESVRIGPDGIPAVIVRVYRARFVLPYLNVTVNSSLEEYTREAETHPVFLIQPAT